MTFFEAFIAFENLYDQECFKRDLKKYAFDEKQAMMKISEVYADLANRYRLIEKSATVNLVNGQYVYTTGTGATQIPEQMIDIKEIALNDEYNTELDKDDTLSTASAGRPGGTPTRWALSLENANRVLTIDTIPDKNFADDSKYRLIVYYWQKIYRYSGVPGTYTWSTLDFTAIGFGGSLLVPTEWEDVIIFGAVASMIDDLKKEYAYRVEQALNAKPVRTSSKMSYNLGV